ncbi:alkyl hydroperoxide reductase/ Thiol specific antioxidant/ Mal allergen [Hymenobacter roseosalivarius DSM 11622]|uniref:Alkyl hydroperoxide reductase/ Thiol specific antioxidant/ Mal allergen n=1 Tax=Hymenobacter roseosalivarius DSM 11622 TaxID=645990 RepID=A0A1W1VEX3_9BACT|nr:TlpA disulfide reductase family protein [Hymenobacter roseosalivarius]SMB91770.1 alkyl hydroperoxide reductase/ Thiol specific antioxidant/ Mal allergen [Hymenobacter roseosalivarius DSM 11622]
MTLSFAFRSLVLSAALTVGLAACQSNSSSENTAAVQNESASALKPGTWRGVLSAQGQEIPFLFDVEAVGGKSVVYLRNGEERLKLDEITTAGDSTTITLGVFDAALVVRADGADKLKGAWVKYDAPEPYRVPFAATAGGQKSFPAASETSRSFDGTWSVTFKDDEGQTYPAVGVFKQNGSDVTGTFLTTTGDYRYLDGQVNGDMLQLSTFDGNHGYLFVATRNSGTNTIINGDFYSGKSGHETWTARLDANAKLPDANSLTFLKPGEKKLDFKFPNIYEGGSISPSDPKYRGKVVVVQLLGSWCPNCMDETNFLAPWYEKNKSRGVEVIGLGFERSPDQKKASQRLLKMKERLNVGYDLAVAGIADKDAAGKALPQINKVLAFPTTIILDKKGEVRKIHTGFSGPGTGKYYEEFVADFNQTIDQLVKE